MERGEHDSVSILPSSSRPQHNKLIGPLGAPFAWAESRQELCETLPYYRSFHSGCYYSSAKTSSSRLREKKDIAKDCIPYGYLLAGFGASRDAWEQNGRVIISHGGGKSESDSRLKTEQSGSKDLHSEGKVHLMGDQTLDDHQVSCLVHSHRNQTPIVLLISRDYKLSHFKLPCAFAVLGWYWITDVWCEREGSSTKEKEQGWVRWKFKFQYIQSQGNPWWLGNESTTLWHPSQSTRLQWLMPSSVERSTLCGQSGSKVWSSSKRLHRPPHLISVTVPEVDQYSEGIICSHCSRHSPVVFKEGWMCLSPDCVSFWKLQGATPSEQELHLSSSILKVKSEPKHFAYGGVPFSLLPQSTNAEEEGATDPLRGLHCTCGRLTCRQFDQYWRCAHCGYIKPCPAGTQERMPPLVPHLTGLEESRVNQSSCITVSSKSLPGENLRMTSFIFPEKWGSGEVHLVESLNGREGEADDIFKAMQEVPTQIEIDKSQHLPWMGKAIPFRRHALSCHSVKGDLLSQQFTCNYGKEYKHTVKMGTMILSQAPSSVLRALQLIKIRTRKVIQNAHDFNEVYPVKYLETQKMNFHDDGEPGLGPTVSSLSLGAEAKMLFRLKEKYLSVQPPKKDSPEQLLQEEGWRHEERDAGIPSITMSNRILLSLPLRHGCVVIQHGRKLQEMIEHAVQPQMGAKQRGDERLRLSVTARRIDVVATEAVKAVKQRTKKRKHMVVQSVMKLPDGLGYAPN